MHQENMIAAAEHPVPIDLEMVLQASVEEYKTGDPETRAFEAVAEALGNSVLMVGLLPTYVRFPENKILAFGGVISGWNDSKRLVTWQDPNSDAMRPATAAKSSQATPNLPHVDGRYAQFSDHVDDFVVGFETYATFLLERIAVDGVEALLEGFDDVFIRKVIRPTQFYSLLLQRLRNHTCMDDGVLWSVQTDFLARLANWDRDTDSDRFWPLQRAERAALVTLNVPYFGSAGDGNEIGDLTGTLVETTAVPGFTRAKARMRNLDRHDIAWQKQIIHQSTVSVQPPADLKVSDPQPRRLGTEASTPAREVCARGR
jgi:lantibiotic modifying enzyme